MFNVLIFEDSLTEDAPPKIVEYDLSTFKYTKSLFNLGNKCTSTSIQYNDFDQLIDGSYLFQRNQTISRIIDGFYKLINGEEMFDSCTALKKVNARFDNLVNGYCMFYLTPLVTFSGNLNNLVNGYEMFCTEDPETYEGTLSIFNTNNLDNLNEAAEMFYGSQLQEFNYDLKSLREAYSMFDTNLVLKSFCSNTSKLVSAPYMFSACEQLTDCICDLSSLVVGTGMFTSCKLNARSVMYILESIRDIQTERSQYTEGVKDFIIPRDATAKKYEQGFNSDSNDGYVYTVEKIYVSREAIYQAVTIAWQYVDFYIGNITIGTDISENEINGKNHEQQKLEFANEIGYSTWEDLNQAFVDKGWQVDWQFNGPVQAAYRMPRNKVTLPIYAKLIEIQPKGVEEGKEEKVYTEHQKRHAKYCTQDGSKYYHIVWGHEVTNTEGYTKYDSLEDVLTNNGLIRKEELQ